MKLLDVGSGVQFEAEINPVEESDLHTISHSGQFVFDWTTEENFTVYKITEQYEDEILGLMSIIDVSEEFRIHINLIESSNDNKGAAKKVDWITGCMIAFAAQISFEKGYQGFVSLLPKTVLIDYYIKKYGFSQYGRNLAIDTRGSIKLIQKYLST